MLLPSDNASRIGMCFKNTSVCPAATPATASVVINLGSPPAMPFPGLAFAGVCHVQNHREHVAFAFWECCVHQISGPYIQTGHPFRKHDLFLIAPNWSNFPLQNASVPGQEIVLFFTFTFLPVWAAALQKKMFAGTEMRNLYDIHIIFSGHQCFIRV